jgi:hypothetical protein
MLIKTGILRDIISIDGLLMYGTIAPQTGDVKAGFTWDGQRRRDIDYPLTNGPSSFLYASNIFFSMVAEPQEADPPCSGNH